LNLFTRLSFDEQQRQSNHEHVGLLIRNLSVGELRFFILKIHSIRSIRSIRSCSHTSPFLLQIDEKLFEMRIISVIFVRIIDKNRNFAEITRL